MPESSARLRRVNPQIIRGDAMQEQCRAHLRTSDLSAESIVVFSLRLPLDAAAFLGETNLASRVTMHPSFLSSTLRIKKNERPKTKVRSWIYCFVLYCPLLIG